MPVATQRATGIVTFIAIIAFIHSASCGLIPNFSAHVLTFLKIWISWMIVFTVCLYNLMRDEQLQLEGFPSVDFKRISSATCWNLTLMAVMVTLAITIHRELQNSRFHKGDYYCFPFCFLVISVICIRLFQRVSSSGGKKLKTEWFRWYLWLMVWENRLSRIVCREHSEKFYNFGVWTAKPRVCRFDCL